MASLKELQSAIDQKKIDTRSLAPQQMEALDQAFKSGELKGYEGVEDYSRLINLGAQSVAGVKQKRLEGMKTATGMERGDLVFYGAAGASMIPYFKNKDALMDAFVQQGFKDRYGVDTRFGNMSEVYNKRFSVLKDSLKKLPNVRGPAGIPIRMLGNLAGMVDNTIDFFQKARKFGTTPQLATEATSLLAGATGAAAGSVLYDMGNLGSDFVAATSADMANLTDNDIRKLPFAERTLFNALSEANNDMLWAGGALSLLPVVKFAVKSGVKNQLGLNSEQSKEIARSYERVGMKPNVAALIPGNNAFQNFFKKFFSTIGVYPLVSGPLVKFNKDTNKKLSQEAFLEAADNLNLAPGSNISIMNYAGANEIKKEWAKVLDTISTEYGEVRKYWEEIGNPKFIPTKTVKQETERLLEQIKTEYPTQYYDMFTDAGPGRDLMPTDDSLVQYVRYLNEITRNTGHIRMSDWSGLSRMQTAAYTNTKFNNVKPQILVVRNALERDLNSMNDATVRSNLKNEIFKDEYADILAKDGPQAAEDFIDRNIRTANLGFNRLKEANSFYSMVLRPFNTNKVAKQLKSMDSKLFADKGIEMVGPATIYPDEVFDKVIRRILASDSPDAVKQLKQVLGVTRSSYDILDEAGKVKRTVKIPNSKESQEMYDRYVRTWFWDSWNNSTQFPLRDHQGLSAQAIAAEASKKGFKTKRLFQLDDTTEQRIRAKTKTNETFDVTEIDGRVFTEGQGMANLNDGMIRNHDFGELDIDKFVKNIGLDQAQGQDKIREIFGGGVAGEKALQRIKDIVAIKRSLDSVDFTDPSKFVQRSITLRAGSSGGILAGATSAAFGFGSTFKLILGSRLFGSLLTSPKIAENMMEMNQYMRFMSDDPNVVSLKPQLVPRASRTFARFINSLMEAEGDDFRVDPNKIDFEEIRQKIQSLDPNIPLSNKFDFGTMPKFTRDRIYPEFETAKNLTQDTAMAGEEFLQGANLMAKSEDNFDQIANSNPMLQATEPQAMVPPQNTQPQQVMNTGQMPQATGQNNAQTFASLFPRDNLGQAVANNTQQPMQLNKGGFVGKEFIDDIYEQVEDVLNA